MKLPYPRIQARFKQAQSRKKLLNRFLLPLVTILIISITTTFAQGNMNHIYLAGQITNIENGAPIAGQAVYIESNSDIYGGLNYFLAAYTDAYGFFYDTISTNALDGSLEIYTFDEFSQQYEKVEYFRFNWYSEYHLTTSLKIVDTNTLTDFQANFTALKDTITNDSLSFFFQDESTAENDDIIAWFWDFGDGSASTEVNPSHVYMQRGIYDVKLTVSTQPINNDIKTSTIVKKVKAGMREYYNFGGHAFAGYFPVDIGTAYLYKVEGNNFIPIDTTEFDQYGFYFFTALIEGNYKVKTFPSLSSANAGKYFPTYYGDALLWTKAQTINLEETSWEYDISMIPSYSYNSGNSFIDGIVTVSETDDPEIENIEVILFNEIDNCLTYLKSGRDGSFRFIELPYGTYKIMAEVPGKYTYPTTITLSEEQPNIGDLSILIYNEEMSFGTGSELAEKIAAIGDLYPNPARSVTKLDISL
ncbi:MAG TPA: PKD domain-containing protein, partial [Bacteroidales bacterium]|nr:PKD domain-containing protein [Bacteroidales bacterium]